MVAVVHRLDRDRGRVLPDLLRGDLPIAQASSEQPARRCTEPDHDRPSRERPLELSLLSVAEPTGELHRSGALQCGCTQFAGHPVWLGPIRVLPLATECGVSRSKSTVKGPVVSRRWGAFGRNGRDGRCVVGVRFCERFDPVAGLRFDAVRVHRDGTVGPCRR
jgi:hypothetical protein